MGFSAAHPYKHYQSFAHSYKLYQFSARVIMNNLTVGLLVAVIVVAAWLMGLLPDRRRSEHIDPANAQLAAVHLDPFYKLLPHIAAATADRFRNSVGGYLRDLPPVTPLLRTVAENLPHLTDASMDASAASAAAGAVLDSFREAGVKNHWDLVARIERHTVSQTSRSVAQELIAAQCAVLDEAELSPAAAWRDDQPVDSKYLCALSDAAGVHRLWSVRRGGSIWRGGQPCPRHDSIESVVCLPS